MLANKNKFISINVLQFNMKLKYIPLLAILLIGVIFISGCTQDFKPQVSLTLDKNSITINNNQLSEFITATITRLDNENIDTLFVLKFPDNKEGVYPTNVDGERITEISTKTLKGSNSKDILQFKIFGSKGEATQASYDLKVELWWNNTKIENQDETTKITVN